MPNGDSLKSYWFTVRRKIYAFRAENHTIRRNLQILLSQPCKLHLLLSRIIKYNPDNNFIAMLNSKYKRYPLTPAYVPGTFSFYFFIALRQRAIAIIEFLPRQRMLVLSFIKIQVFF